MLATVNKFSEWLLVTLEHKDWSQADLARAANVSRAAISDLISGRRQVGKGLATSIAVAFKIPPEQVFRIAGLLPDKSDKEDPWVEAMSHKLNMLSPRLRNVAERFIDTLVEDDEAEHKTKTKPNHKSAKA